VNYLVLCAIEAWAVRESLNSDNNSKYRAALSTLADAIKAVRSFN
jgi:hypothetical protein